MSQQDALNAAKTSLQNLRNSIGRDIDVAASGDERAVVNLKAKVDRTLGKVIADIDAASYNSAETVKIIVQRGRKLESLKIDATTLSDMAAVLDNVDKRPQGTYDFRNIASQLRRIAGDLKAS